MPPGKDKDAENKQRIADLLGGSLPESSPQKRKPDRKLPSKEEKEPEEEADAAPEGEPSPQLPEDPVPKLRSVPRTKKGQPKKFASPQVRKRRTQYWAAACLLLIIVGVFQTCSGVFLNNTPSADRDHTHPASPEHQTVAYREAIKWIEQDYQSMMPFPGKAAFMAASESFASRGQSGAEENIALLERRGSQRVIDLQPFSAAVQLRDGYERHTFLATVASERVRYLGGAEDIDNTSTTEQYWITLLMGINNESLVLEHKILPSVSAAGDTLNDSSCPSAAERTVLDPVEGRVREWAEAWLAGDNISLYRFSGDRTPETVYSAWGDLYPSRMTGMLIYQDCLSSNDNVVTAVLFYQLCDSATRGSTALNLLIEEYSTLNPLVVAWGREGREPQKGRHGISTDEEARADSGRRCPPQETADASILLEDAPRREETA